jgi:cell division protein FtsI (penicillin-binding protein 3)
LTELVEVMLRAELDASNAGAGSIVIMDVASGKPVALRGLARTEQGDFQVADELVHSARVEHGSIMMLPMLMIGMEEQRLRLDQRFGRNGGEHDSNGVLMRDPEPISTDSLSLAEAFVQRSNVVVATAITEAYVGDGDRILSKLRAIDLLQPEFNSADRLPWIAIGYEATQTPLQVLEWYGRIAQAQLAGRNASAELGAAHDLLLRSVAYLNSKGVLEPLEDVAGQISLVQFRGADGHQKYRTAFIGYFPAEAPRYCFLVATERPSTAGYANAEATMRITQSLLSMLREF